MLRGLGSLLVGAGVVLVLAGLALSMAGRLGLGSLPGDLSFSRGGLHVYLPLASSLLISIVITVLANLFLGH